MRNENESKIEKERHIKWKREEGKGGGEGMIER